MGFVKLTEDDQGSTKGSRGSAAAGSLQGQENGRDKKDTAERRKHAHSNVRDTGLQIVLADLLEVEAAVEAGEPTEEGDHELRKRRVNVHEELALDVLRRESTEAAEQSSC